MSLLTVQSGPFRFCTKSQLDQIRLKFAAEAASFNSGLAGAAINGSSFTFSHAGREYSREQFGDALAAAYNQLGVSDYGHPTGNRATTRF